MAPIQLDLVLLAGERSRAICSPILAGKPAVSYLKPLRWQAPRSAFSQDGALEAGGRPSTFDRCGVRIKPVLQDGGQHPGHHRLLGVAPGPQMEAR